MKNTLRLLFVALLVAGVANSVKAEMFKGKPTNGNRNLKQTTAGCSPSSAFEWLNINNVKTRINAGGDMWWDLPGGIGSQYYIPASGSATSLYAGSLWIAGTDVNGQLKCAAVRFRQDGNDFWTGPLKIKGASIDEETCAAWDQIFRITREEVDQFLNHTDPETGAFVEPEDGYTIPKSILEWPAHPETVGGNVDGVSHYMAPFFDRDGDGEYNPYAGDYPYYDIENKLCHTKIPTPEEERVGTIKGSILVDHVLKGDQTLWWVFNDKGNSHTESNGAAIGLEVRAQAFAFSTNDEINNMSFCSYEIINRSTYTLANTFFCPWTDVDLGYAKDDYVGCDVARGLGYGYNGDGVDGSGEPEAYGNQPPAVGIDFFQGPYMDADGIDNPKYKYTINSTVTINPATGDSIVTNDTLSFEQICDESINGVNFGNGIVDDERFGMRRFLYHNNSNGPLGDPDNAAETYLLLQSIWRTGFKMMYGGTGYPTGSNSAVGPECDFMFPGNTDPCNWGTHGLPPNGGYNTNGKYWTEENESNPPEDRRFMQSAGPFTLKPGAVNYITFGVPWARATSGGPMASVELLRVTDDKCQALFDNCFKVIDGPNAPDLTIRELDQKLIIYLSNSPISNNYREGYVEEDNKIPLLDPSQPDSLEIPADRFYRFEGYKVFQLLNDEVGADELSDNSKARLVFQCDIKNQVSNLVNYQWDNYIGGNVPSLKVSGADGGITHSFVVTEDKFSTGDSPALVNHKTYYYMAVAYAYNNFLTYSQEPSDLYGLHGQMTPYLEGRKNIQCYTAVPHQIMNGTVMKANYGDMPSITRVVGQGNGGNEIELTQECVDEIFSKKLANTVILEGGKEHIAYSNTNADTVDVVCFGHPDYPVVYHPTFKVGYGPLSVKIIDPLMVKSRSYELWFDTLYPHYTHGVSTNQSVVGDSALRYASHWYLRDCVTNDTLKSDTITVYADEKLFIDRGISITVDQQYAIGPVTVGIIKDSSGEKTAKEILAPNNGMITSSLTFQDSTQKWLDGIRDVDVTPVLNWIRSGTYVDQDQPSYHDYSMSSATGGNSIPYDPNENYEKIANRTWAPFVLTSINNEPVGNPGPIPDKNYRYGEYFARLNSIDIVFTSDRSKWTRCPVVEMCMDPALAQGGAARFRLRKAPSIDKDGKPYTGEWDYTIYGDSVVNGESFIKASDNPDDPNYIAAQGMGWFPGYVIDQESGMRLNLLYGEDSYLADLNGRDMMFNPPQLKKTTVDGTTEPDADPVLFRQVDAEPVLGGKHFVYIWGLDRPTDVPQTPAFKYKDFNSPAYDAGKYLFKVLNAIQNAGANNLITQYSKRFWRQCLWVGMPMGVEGTEWLPAGNDAKIRIRIGKPYTSGYGCIDLDSVYPDLDINNLYPKFTFAIDGLDPELNNAEKTESDLDKITVVPNPYYAYSSYEANALVNRVKITNLPDKCVVTIYNIAGTKIRQFKKDNQEPSIDWDLTNFANTPVASGFYLIHVKDNTSGGERTIKFFGAMRQIDLNTF